MTATKNLHIPTDIMEEILLNLSVKSLLRFSSVSKFWNTMIFESRSFGKRYRGLERIAFQPCTDEDYDNGSTFALSSIPFGINLVVDTANFICPFGGNPTVKAMCEQLWFAFDGKSQSLFIWNPSIRMHKKLPNPSLNIHPSVGEVFGLGYDSVGDDYKILKIPRLLNEDSNEYAELYSVRSDSWKKIPSTITNIVESEHGVYVGEVTHGVFVGGKLHWKVFPIFPNGRGDAIIMSFDLSTEELGVVAQPEVVATWKLSVLRGMLCMSLHKECHYTGITCSIWMMEDYGVAKSWTKKFSIQCSPIFGNNRILPLYLYDNGDVLVRTITEETRIFVYRHNKCKAREIIYSKDNRVVVYRNNKRKAREINYSSNWGDFLALSYVDSFAAAAGMQSADAIVDSGLQEDLTEGEAGKSTKPKRECRKPARYLNWLF